MVEDTIAMYCYIYNLCKDGFKSLERERESSSRGRGSRSSHVVFLFAYVSFSSFIHSNSSF